MTTLLDELKERLEAAKVRLTLAQQRHQAAQVELNAVAGEHRKRRRANRNTRRSS